MAGKKKKNPAEAKRKLKYFTKKTVFYSVEEDHISFSEGFFCVGDEETRQEMLAEARYLQSLKDKTNGNKKSNSKK